MDAKINPATLTKAVLRSAEALGLTPDLPQILAVDEPVVAEIKAGSRVLDPALPQWEAATRFVSLFRSLLALLGSAEAAREWLRKRHQTLDAVPAELLRDPVGRERVLKYLDAVQKYEIKLPPRTQH